jgi:DNA topoisomerase-1
VVDTGKSKVVAELKKGAVGVGEILLATDPDREGEAIAWHCQYLLTEKKKVEVKKIKRISFHEITREAIEEAIGKAGKIDMDLVSAQQGRRVLDRVVGYSLSPVLWKKVRRGLSAGRVQSVVVRLVCEREIEIEKFKKEKFFRLTAELLKGKDKFEAELIEVASKKFIESKKIELFDGNYSYSRSIFSKKTEVDEFLKSLSNEFKVEKVVARASRRQPAPAFTTSRLQQAAASRMGWSGRQTMSVAQQLYEKGLITYHRTDSVYLAKKATDQFADFIGKKYGKDYVVKTPRFYKNKSKNAQEAHEAIRPTRVEIREGNGMDGREEKLYQMIWKRAVATAARAAEMENTTVDLSNGTGLFRANGVRMLFDGFLKISGEKHEDQLLPKLSEGDKLTKKKVISVETETSPPPRYNDASLVRCLERQGIGRPSTYAPIISTIQNRQYVIKEEGKFMPTVLGIASNKFLVENFPSIMSLPFTAEMEEDLDEVAMGKLDWKKMIKSFWQGFSKKLKKVEKNSDRVRVETEKVGRKCPECKKGELVIRLGRFGKFISCDQFPECKHTEPFMEWAGFDCPECGARAVVKKTKRGRKFFGCSKYPKCKWAGWKKP